MLGFTDHSFITIVIKMITIIVMIKIIIMMMIIIIKKKSDNFPAFYRCLQHPCFASCFVVIKKGNLLRP